MSNNVAHLDQTWISPTMIVNVESPQSWSALVVDKAVKASATLLSIFQTSIVALVLSPQFTQMSKTVLCKCAKSWIDKNNGNGNINQSRSCRIIARAIQSTDVPS